ncbi:MAG TPA: hypothetical protein VM913_06130 [Sphingomicrobium sp.]|nr:hypothetical protein [Sphingomicrobium sp.]
MLLIFVFVGVPSSADAQPAGSAVPPSVGAITACKRVVDQTQRLACYDSAADSLVRALQQGDVAVVSREQANRTRRSLFGFAVPDIPFLKGRSDQPEIREIRSTVVTARPFSNGLFRIVLADGSSVWETTESVGIFRDPRAGEPVTIKRGVLGSYWLKVGSQREVRARRVR